MGSNSTRRRVIESFELLRASESFYIGHLGGRSLKGGKSMRGGKFCESFLYR